ALLKIARNPLFEVARLADVERLAGRIEHPVDTRTMRQRAKKLRHVERGRRRRLGGSWSRHFRQTRNLGHAIAPGARPRCTATSSNTARNISRVSRRALVL